MRRHQSAPGRSGRRGVKSYREELRLRDERAVNDAFWGGAFGCPGEYFRGAAAMDCRSGFRLRCPLCWGSPYGDEEWIGDDQSDE